MKSFAPLIIYLLLPLSSIGAECFAQTDESMAPRPQEVVVVVRTVEALNPFPENAMMTAPAELIGDGLEDLRGKLQKLHFKTFRLLGTHAQRVPLMQKESIALVRGQTLTVRPLYLADHRIGMWIKWRDAAGMDVLDTRMHFDSDESVITGTDSEGAGGAGVVLAIDVKPSQQ